MNNELITAVRELKKMFATLDLWLGADEQSVRRKFQLSQSELGRISHQYWIEIEQNELLNYFEDLHKNKVKITEEVEQYTHSLFTKALIKRIDTFINQNKRVTGVLQ
jgi:Cu2+-containing amine oxidase